MNVNERNANALNAEQIRQREVIVGLEQRIAQLEQSHANLIREVQQFRTQMAIQNATRGATQR